MKLIPKILLGLGLAALPALCGPISLDQWYSFGWSGSVTSPTSTPGLTGFPAYTGALGTSVATTTCPVTAPCVDPWTFTGTGTLMIQDLFYDGDQFAVYDNGSLILTSSTPANDGALCGPTPYNDPLGCSGNAKFSSGWVFLPGGSHSISIFLVGQTTGINSGRAVFEVATVPEPTTMSLMALGLAGILVGWRKRRA